MTETVAIARIIDQRIDDAVAQLIELLGGLNTLIPAGSRVVIKPNLVFPPTDRGVTHSEVIEAVTRLVAQTSPADIAIAEGSADVYTGQGFRFKGCGYIAARYGARLIDLNLEPGVRTPVPPETGREYIMVPRVVSEADVFISIPVWKLWGNGPCSLSLKNLIGCYGGRYYGHNHDSLTRAGTPHYSLAGDVGTELGAHQPDVANSIAALNCAIKTHLAIIDGLEGGNGKGDFIQSNVLFAGTNPAATDTVAIKAAGFDARDHAPFARSAELGVGPIDLDEINVVGETIADVAFELNRLNGGGVRDMPLGWCLRLLSTLELAQIQRAWHAYGMEGIAPLPDDMDSVSRDDLLALVEGRMSEPGYFTWALDQCTGMARALLEVMFDKAGTHGSFEGIKEAFNAVKVGNESLYFLPSHRVLTRLGLAYLVDGTMRPYDLLPEGLEGAWKVWREARS